MKKNKNTQVDLFAELRRARRHLRKAQSTVPEQWRTEIDYALSVIDAVGIETCGDGWKPLPEAHTTSWQ